MKTELELVSFALCPYVQRSVITLLEKKSEFKLTFIDIMDPPEWFVAISPLEQVPVLRVRREGKPETVLFESAVINEYLDETVDPRMHPSDPLDKARDRAWIEVGSGLLGTNYEMSLAQDPEELGEKMADLFDTLGRVEGALGDGPFWRGSRLSLVDAAWAPLFMRLELSPKTWDHGFWKKHPKTRAWAEKLLATESVRRSVREDFRPGYLEFLEQADSLLVQE